jgi:hypothetical protein
MTSEFFDMSEIRSLYDEAYNLEAKEPNFYLDGPRGLKEAALAFLQLCLEHIEEDTTLPDRNDWRMISYVRRVINCLTSEKEWKERVCTPPDEGLVSGFAEAQAVLAPYIERLEQIIDYGQVAGNDAFKVFRDPMAYEGFPYRIAWATYYPDREEGEEHEDLDRIVEGGYVPGRYGREPIHFRTAKEAADYLREHYEALAATEE